MKYNIFKKIIWCIIITGVYNSTMHGMEDMPLADDNKAIVENNDTEEKNEAKPVEVAAPGWTEYLTQWYQGPFFTLMSYLLHPQYKNLNLKEDGEKAKLINNLFEPALKSIAYNKDITTKFDKLKSLVESLKAANITITGPQQDYLQDAYKLLILEKQKSFEYLKQEIEKQNTSNAKYYKYIQGTVLPLLQKLNNQVAVYDAALRNIEGAEKHFYHNNIIPLVVAFAHLFHTEYPEEIQIKAAKDYINYSYTIGIDSVLPQQIENLKNVKEQVDRLEAAFKNPLIKNSNT